MRYAIRPPIGIILSEVDSGPAKTVCCDTLLLILVSRTPGTVNSLKLKVHLVIPLSDHRPLLYFEPAYTLLKVLRHSMCRYSCPAIMAPTSDQLHLGKTYGSTDISEIIMPSMRTTSIINQGGNVRHVDTMLVTRFWNYKVIEMVGLMMRIE
ncbi:predicted protein [Lichtheimia corymbifera JMRC:FSU:9682]|uniref:Uncharacterized protein n=1 Tax=Lichtheimia corymbifera JMRC:FSU:9682 TaxID=1263082 RepID=A0A068RRM3_9FUNG|nr:predicted protein [Lichtheimia corymbifera JMRC:FSU:9682]